jgi:hypothetical protein
MACPRTQDSGANRPKILRRGRCPAPALFWWVKHKNTPTKKGAPPKPLTLGLSPVAIATHRKHSIHTNPFSATHSHHSNTSNKLNTQNFWDSQQLS